MENQQATRTANTSASPADTALTEVQAKAILDNVEKESPDRWPAAVKTTIVGAYRAIGYVAALATNIAAAVSKLGSDIDAHKEELKKLMASHKRLALLTIELRNEVKNLKSGSSGSSVPGVEETIAATRVVGENAATPTQSETPPAPAPVSDGAPNSPIPQDDAEALMDAAIAAATGESVPIEIPVVETPVEQAVASPSSGGRRRARQH